MKKKVSLDVKTHGIKQLISCQELSQAVQKEYQALAKEFKIEGANDIGLLQREMKDKVIPMEPEVFKRQAEKGISMKDIASGSSAGRDKFK